MVRADAVVRGLAQMKPQYLVSRNLKTTRCSGVVLDIVVSRGTDHNR